MGSCFQNYNNCWVTKLLISCIKASLKKRMLYKKFKGNFPTTGSPTVTLLRLHQNNLPNPKYYSLLNFIIQILKKYFKTKKCKYKQYL